MPDLILIGLVIPSLFMALGAVALDARAAWRAAIQAQERAAAAELDVAQLRNALRAAKYGPPSSLDQGV